MKSWVEDLNAAVLHSYNTRLVGGFDEPFYRAAVNGQPAEIRFTRDYARSALHELAHWCVAGEQRRRLDDYGYWYAPDGRDAQQQQLFFRVEVQPQAIEKHFCYALGLTFDVSVDNLNNPDINGLESFRQAVDGQFLQFSRDGLPTRAASIATRLAQHRYQQTI
jgi:elongation factor P hydroxylase